MQITSGVAPLHTSQRYSADNSYTSSKSPAAESNSANPSPNGGAKQADFTKMTRQEMLDWVNTEITTGEMSLDEGFPFMAMTMKISVDSGQPIPVSDDSARYDMTQKVRDGIDGALKRNDQETFEMLSSALSIINKCQGKTLGVDTTA